MRKLSIVISRCRIETMRCVSRLSLWHIGTGYCAGMIYLKLQQASLLINYKRIDWLYAEADPQVKRRKRKQFLYRIVIRL
jgi:hypothetical protein